MLARRLPLFGALLSSAAIAVLAGCTREDGRPASARPSEVARPAPARPPPAPPVPGSPAAARADDHRDVPLHSYKRLSERLIAGASPEKDTDFAFLAREGVKTIITVDGARPDVEGAAK